MGFRRSNPRGNARGLAEIVGTLMLVLIVVAAVTAFSFYVATVEQTDLNERTQLHYKNLENVTVQGVVFGTVTVGTLSNNTITLDLSSTDIYATYVTDVEINGNPATSYCLQSGTSLGCYNFPINGGFTLNLSQFSVIPVTFFTGGTAGGSTSFYLPWTAPGPSGMLINIGTTRGNEFQDTLFPPVPKIGIQFVDNYPILDGTGSYQPHEGTFVNATIDSWTWTVTDPANPTDPDIGTYNGQQAQMPDPFISGAAYTITLTCTNTLGLSATTTESYTAP